MIRVIRQTGPPQPLLDGYGLLFDPVKHALYVLVGIAECKPWEPPTPPVEPVWKGVPAGRSKCPTIHEDHEQGKGHYA